MGECRSLGGKGAVWLDLVISLNHSVYVLENLWYLNQRFFLSAFESYLACGENAGVC